MDVLYQKAAVVRRKFGSLLRLSWQEKCWFALLYPLSGIIRFTLLTLKFRRLAPLLGRHYDNYQLSPLVSESALHRAWQIGRIIILTARYTPWQSKCLVQAAMARIFLGYYRIPYVLHLGAVLTADATEPMKGHAWVKVGPWIIVGGKGHKQYAIVSSFLAPSLLNREPR